MAVKKATKIKQLNKRIEAKTKKVQKINSELVGVIKTDDALKYNSIIQRKSLALRELHNLKVQLQKLNL